jgi:multicomponent Na+:H+ antiporter subunit C
MTGALYACALYMMMRRSMIKLIVGIALLSHASNLLLFTVSGVQRGNPPLLGDHGAPVSEGPTADPLPQALILTAIVISFGILAFALALIQRTYESVGSDDLDEMRTTDR